MNHKILIIIKLLILTFIVSCEKERGTRIWLNLRETQCSNPWDIINLNNTESKIKEYLKQNDIRLFDIQIEIYSYGPFCAACDCPSGRTIRVLILDSDLEEFKKLDSIFCHL